ncbi:c-type cytochrome biogenesis protein CcmI [Tamilnaduibacter salinus]|uniref:C-type cytochrome biogenesis protein CcmI n=1 Tax=Tamilnaduibacter salinus TaxID=1484056 RepID=A0A2A2I569_9GAMM|nr:c-type cytochrome biogenesis protein CcmI [Tamilnaduibacter salinus]PAV26446.1 c-type cytochrome biogenesis protein CcmI [Tamilnaduibacter salinus]
MTTEFWIGLTAMIGLALVFVLAPVMFYKRPTQDGTSTREQNLAAYRSRLMELDEDYHAGRIDGATWQQMKDELAGSLLDDVGENAAPRHDAGRRPAVVVGLVALILIPAVSIGLYQDWGALSDLEQYRTMQAMDDSGGNRVQRMTDLAGQLRDRLTDSPDNPRGWAMLGRTYMTLERYQDAAWAFRQLAGHVQDGTERAATAWGLAAQAEYFVSRGTLSDRVQSAIKKARERNPNEVNALGVLGVHAFSQEAYREALGYWERILEVAPDHPRVASIRDGVAEAYRRLGEPVPESVRSAMADDGGAFVTVRVSLADRLQGEVPPETALFVFAKAAGGGPMPLAAARLKASQLPTTIRLDDSMAMTESRSLSDADRVMVTARLSRSGEVQPQSGDWQGQLLQPVTLADYQGQPLALTIDRVIP